MIETLLARFQKLPTLYIVTILAIATFFCYFNTLGNGLFYDDEFFIYNNIYVQQFSLPEFFTKNVDAGGGVVSNYYRPLLLILFSLTYQVAGATGGPYHFLSIIFHLCAGVGVFFVCKKFSSKLVAFVTALLFLIHPLQTEAVSYASGISDPIYVTFVMLTLLMFLNNTKRSLFLTPLFFSLALLSKESAFITPGLMIVVAWMKERSLDWKSYKKYLPTVTACIVVLISYGALRLTALNFDNTLNFVHDSSAYSTSLLVRLLTFASILPTYIGLLLYPQTLFIDRVAQVVTIITPQGVFIIATLIILGICAVLTHKKFPSLLFSFLWFFISILPMSGITPINGIIYEHFLYLPSIGFFFMFASLVALLYHSLSSSVIKNVLCLLLATYCLLLSIRTIVRNSEWASPFTLYPQLLSHNPKSVRALNNYAMALAASGQQKKAVTYYHRALSLQENYPQVRFNMGNSYRSLGENKEAEAAYLTTISKFPNFYQSYQSLYGIYIQTNQTDKAKSLLQIIAKKGETNQNFQALYEYLKQQTNQ
jgi:hypothetical protein